MIDLRLLSGSIIEMNGSPVKGRAVQRRRLALLTILALSPNRSATRDRLLAFLWPEHPTDAGRRLLSEAIYIIRKELGDDVLQSSGELLTMSSPPVRSDVDDFNEAYNARDFERVCVIRQFPLLDGWFLSDSPEFERWLDQHRNEIDSHWRTAVGIMALRARQSADYPAEIALRRKLLASDRYASDNVLSLAEALHKRGDRTEALRVLDRHCDDLQTDFETSAPRELLALRSQLRDAVAVAPATTVPQTLRTPLVQITVPGPVDGRSAPDLSSVDWPAVDLPGGDSSRGVLPESQTSSSAPAIAEIVSTPGVRKPAVGTSRVLWRSSMATLLLVLGGFFWKRPSKTPKSRLDPFNIAVLYFDDHSENRDLGYLADGITEELIHDLGGVTAFRVVSRNGVKPFRDSKVLVDSIARVLNAGSIIEGSVQKSDSLIRVTAQLIDGNTGKRLSSLVISAKRTELFRLEADIATRIAADLQRHVGREVRLDLIGAGTRNNEARELVYRAMSMREAALDASLSEHPNDVRALIADLWRTDTLLARAQELDSKWTRPQLDRIWIRYLAADAQFDSARVRAADSAVALAGRFLIRNPESAEALALSGGARWLSILGRSGSGSRQDSTQILAAERELRLALQRDPTLAFGWTMLSSLQLLKTSYAEAEQSILKALAADSHLEGAERLFFQLFASAYVVGDVAAAGEWCKRGQALYPRHWHLLECELTLMKKMSRPSADSAWAIVRRIDQLDPVEQTQAAGHAYSPIYRRLIATGISASAGDRDRAMAGIRQAQAMAANDKALQDDMTEELAYVYVRLGQDSIASAILRRGVREGSLTEASVRRDTMFQRLFKRFRY